MEKTVPGCIFTNTNLGNINGALVLRCDKLPDPKCIQGKEISSIDSNEFWIKHLEIEAEMQHNVGEKRQV